MIENVFYTSIKNLKISNRTYPDGFERLSDTEVALIDAVYRFDNGSWSLDGRGLLAARLPLVNKVNDLDTRLTDFVTNETRVYRFNLITKKWRLVDRRDFPKS